MTESPTLSATEAIRLAHSDRSELVPVIGAGTSLALGLPSWPDLIGQLQGSARPDSRPVIASPPEALRRIKAELGETAFVARIQGILRLPSYVTSVALQALAGARLRRLITTNLDYAIEAAFQKTGRALSPAQIGRGCTVEELALFDQPDQPVLLKIHGSLERPSSWVLTADEYDRAYYEPGTLRRFLESKCSIPIFIGCSFSDSDLGQSLRLAKLSWRGKAYAILPSQILDDIQELLKTSGVIPIPFYQFDQIPEIIDDIFRCDPLIVTKTLSLDNESMELRVGGALITGRPSDFGITTVEDAKDNHLVKALTNAFEVQTNSSVLDGKRRRHYGAKGLYKAQIIEMVHSQEDRLIQLLFEAVAQYPETLFSGVLPFLFKQEGLREEEIFWALKELYSGLPDDYSATSERIDALLLEEISDIQLNYQCLRALSKMLAERGSHPAQRVPPVAVDVGRLRVPLYVLTESQVDIIRGRSLLESKSIRPYLLRDLRDAQVTLSQLREATGEDWRLPTSLEWKEIAGITATTSWPWGNERPEYRIHAHLNYVERAGSVAPRSLEVGLFPRGRSSQGVLDLIGNVYELVVASATPSPDLLLAKEASWGQYALAGGSWTSKSNPIWGFRLFSGLHKPRESAGLRPVVDRSS